MVDSDLPSALAMSATRYPHPSMNSMRFFSSLPMCFMEFLLVVSGSGAGHLPSRLSGSGR